MLVFVAYYVAGKLGQATTEIRSSNLGPVWPAYGVALAAVLWFGPRIWPALVASAFLVAFQSPVPPIAAAGQAVAATLAALSGGVLLRWVKFDRALSRLRDALHLIAFGALASAMISATVGVFVLYATGVQAYSGIASAWLVYWLGDSTGVLLMTPLALTAHQFLRQSNRFAEFGLLVMCLVLACLLIFGDISLFSVTLHFLAFAILPFIMWAAIRFGVSGVAVATLLVATIATVATALGDGPFAQNTTFINAFLLDVYFAVLAVSGLTLAAVIAERERVEHEHERLSSERAAIEARLVERHRAAAELRESEDKLRLILDSAGEGIFGADLEGHNTFCNRACLRMLGYETDKVFVGHTMHELIHHSHADGTLIPASECRIRRAFEGGMAARLDEEVFWRADGTSFPVELSVYPQRRDGQIVGMVVCFTDITHQRQAEESAGALRDQLAHLSRVGMLTALTGALAHEINQPLTAVRLNAEAALLILEAQPPRPNELRETLKDIRDDNQRAGDVLQQVRTLLRKDAPRREPVELNSTVSDIVRLTQSSALRRGIMVDIELALDAKPAVGDRVQVQQVVLNLLMNACDAVQGNERAFRRVALKTVTGQDGMRVEVTDHGPGLTEDEMARIFEPFYTTKPDGMGLGLSICRAIVAAHGGTLDAARNVEGGMMFTATFPFWQSESAAHTAATSLRREQL